MLPKDKALAGPGQISPSLNPFAVWDPCGADSGCRRSGCFAVQVEAFVLSNAPVQPRWSSWAGLCGAGLAAGSSRASRGLGSAVIPASLLRLIYASCIITPDKRADHMLNYC